MAEIKYKIKKFTFSRVREIEEQCTVEFGLPNYYSQATIEQVMADHAAHQGEWKETRELRIDGMAIVKGELSSPACDE